ncbi:MAG: phosphoglycerate mutase family protein [Candidatus Thiodiazotropha sp.]
MRLVILRHGRPVIPALRRLSASAFSDWVNEYNTAGLCPTSQPTEHAKKCAQECNAVVCSALPRSIESAKAFRNNNIVLSDPVFNEAALPIANWKIVKLSPKIWAVLFRLLWLLGYSRNSESFKETKSRASEAAKRLSEIAQEYENVLFVGHGVFNRILSNELRRQGWLGPRNPGSTHWSFGVYSR